MGARYSPNTSRRAPAHSPVVPPAWARAMVAGMTFSPDTATRRSSSRARLTASVSRSARHCSTLGDGLGLERRVDLQDGLVAAERGVGGLGEAVDADHDLLAGLDAADPLGVGCHEPALQLLDGGEGAPHAEHLVELGPCRLDQLGGAGLDDVGAGEDVVVLEQVGLEGQHLLHPQRPLLVPRAGQAERLVPRRELEGAGPGVLGEGDAEHLEHDALHVVLGLGLGEPERVDLHAVAEPAGLGVGDAVALEGEPVPHLG